MSYQVPSFPTSWIAPVGCGTPPAGSSVTAANAIGPSSRGMMTTISPTPFLPTSNVPAETFFSSGVMNHN